MAGEGLAKRKGVIVAWGLRSAERGGRGEHGSRPINHVGRPSFQSGEQIGSSLCEPYAALVQHQPAAFDRATEAGLIFRWRGLQLEQHRPVDLPDVDAAVLQDFNRVVESTSLRAATSGSVYARGWTSLLIRACR
jgi:hypothetical protein